MGSANGRYFLFHAGIGFDAAVVEQVERRGSLKRFAGHPLFLYAGMATWLRHYDRTRPHFDVTIEATPGQPGREIADVYFAICLKSNPYTFLGNRPLDVAPEAGMDAGFTILAFQTLSFATVGGAIVASMTGRGGPRLGRRPKVAYAGGLQALRIRGRGPVPYQLDGDYLGQVEDLELVYTPDLLNLVMPSR